MPVNKKENVFSKILGMFSFIEIILKSLDLS